MQQHQWLPPENYRLVHLKIRPLEKEKHRPWTTNFWGSKCMFFRGLGPKNGPWDYHFRPLPPLSPTRRRAVLWLWAAAWRVWPQLRNWPKKGWRCDRNREQEFVGSTLPRYFALWKWWLFDDFWWPWIISPTTEAVSSIQLKNDCEDSSTLGTWNVWRFNLEDHPT